jgi:hypothetical protein
MNASLLRTRWAAIGAAVAVSLGAGGIGISQATTSSGEKPIYVPIEPCRLADTRPAFNVGPRSTPLGSAETYTLSGWGTVGDCNLPTATTGLSLNVTAVGPTLPTFLTLFPAAFTLPNASHLNPAPGQPPTPNAVNVDLDTSGEFSIYNLQGAVHIIVDVVGYYDDHTHDDRYYTESEVDAAIEAARPTVAFAGGDQALDLTATDMVVRKVSIDTPTSGTVLVTSSGYVSTNGTTPFVARCSLTTGDELDFDALQWTNTSGGTLHSEVIGGTRGFTVSRAATLTANLVCDEVSGDSWIYDTALTAIFVPN